VIPLRVEYDGFSAYHAECLVDFALFPIFRKCSAQKVLMGWIEDWKKRSPQSILNACKDYETIFSFTDFSNLFFSGSGRV
jgi:hypothetical protein